LAGQRDLAAVARATQEIQAALVIGQKFPRDEIKAKARILEACKRKELAEVAEYEYARGGTRITGPTIDLLRAIANRWGNIRFGWSEVERRDGQSTIRCFAWDVQTNGQAERSFSMRHWRDTQGGGYEIKDERDIYELIANHAARRVRACLQEVIDSDIVTAAVDQCRRTLKEGEKTPLADRVVKMVTAFMELGVTKGQIEARLQCSADAISENQLASLRRVFKSLQDGVGQREDYFKAEPVKAEFDEKPKPVAPEPTPSDPDDPFPPEAAPAPVPPRKPGPLKLLRDLCKVAKIKEGELLDYLASTGTSEGTSSSLEELQMTEPGIVKLCCDKWAEVVTKIQEAKKAGAA
jgi:hypothetical protein